MYVDSRYGEPLGNISVCSFGLASPSTVFVGSKGRWMVLYIPIEKRSQHSKMNHKPNPFLGHLEGSSVLRKRQFPDASGAAGILEISEGVCVCVFFLVPYD